MSISSKQSEYILTCSSEKDPSGGASPSFRPLPGDKVRVREGRRAGGAEISTNMDRKRKRK
jgi:hypothetical protein